MVSTTSWQQLSIKWPELLFWFRCLFGLITDRHAGRKLYRTAVAFDKCVILCTWTICCKYVLVALFSVILFVAKLPNKTFHLIINIVWYAQIEYILAQFMSCTGIYTVAVHPMHMFHLVVGSSKSLKIVQGQNMLYLYLCKE